MDASEAAAVIVACASVAALVVMVWAVVSLTGAMRDMREAVAELRREALPVVGELQATVGQANTELERVHELLGTAENVTHTVDSASRLAYLAFSNPVIKVMAAATGTRGAARRLRRRQGVG